MINPELTYNQTILICCDVDNLTFTYSGNHLVKVYDSTDDVIFTGATDFNDGADRSIEYTYDANGNMISDANKNITSIQYNALNLPAKITFTDGSTLTNIYSADGTLLRRIQSTLAFHPGLMPLALGNLKGLSVCEARAHIEPGLN